MRIRVPRRDDSSKDLRVNAQGVGGVRVAPAGGEGKVIHLATISGAALDIPGAPDLPLLYHYPRPRSVRSQRTAQAEFRLVEPASWDDFADLEPDEHEELEGQGYALDAVDIDIEAAPPLEAGDLPPAYRDWQDRFAEAVLPHGLAGGLFYFGGAPHWLQGHVSPGAGVFVGMVPAFSLGMSDFVYYLFFDPATGTLTQLAQMS